MYLENLPKLTTNEESAWSPQTYIVSKMKTLIPMNIGEFTVKYNNVWNFNMMVYDWAEYEINVQSYRVVICKMPAAVNKW